MQPAVLRRLVAAALADGERRLVAGRLLDDRDLFRHLQRVSTSAMAHFVSQVRLAWHCIDDTVHRRYDRIPWATVGSLAGALAYFILPLDLIPDWIAGSGFLDDAAVLGAVMRAFDADLRRYAAWRERQSEPPYAMRPASAS